MIWSSSGTGVHSGQNPANVGVVMGGMAVSADTMSTDSGFGETGSVEAAAAGRFALLIDGLLGRPWPGMTGR